MRLATINRKGGVGKTTSNQHIAAGLAQARDLGIGTHNYRTLVIDVDSQGDTSAAFGIPIGGDHPGLADVLLSRVPVFDPIRPTEVPNLSVLPASPRLDAEKVMRVLYHDVAYRFQLQRAVAYLAREFDVIMFDCPPARGILLTMVLLAADAFVIPTTPRFLDKRALWNLLEAFREDREELEEEFRGDETVSVAGLMGLLITDVTPYKNAQRSVADLRGRWKDRVFDTVIPRGVVVDHAQSHTKTLYEYASGSPAGAAYRALTAEVIVRAQQHGWLL